MSKRKRWKPGQYEGLSPEEVAKQAGTAPPVTKANFNQPTNKLPFSKGYIQSQVRKISIHY